MEKDWRRRLLRSLGAPATPANLRFLETWQRWEGGGTHNSASYNPLNTTHGKGQPINSVGVKAFQTWRDGIAATKQTLLNGRYNNIVQGLKAGNPYEQPGVDGDLQTWVSGQRTGNPGYATKVLGGTASPAGGEASVPFGSGSQAPAVDQSALRRAFSGYLLEQISRRQAGEAPDMGGLMQLAAARQQAMLAQKHFGEGPSPGDVKGGILNPGTSWKGTHVTDGLGWGTKTAEDIMAKPGTPVAAPVGGTIKYFHPTGAQGGGSLVLVGEDGHEYWLGHIANGLKAGTRVQAGQPIAVISGDHPRPHLHIDRR